MQAVVYTKYGPPEVLKLAEVEKPTPKDNEVLVKVKASSINYSDWAFVRGKPLLVRLTFQGLFKPKNTILGADIAGIVEAVGKNIKQFQPGDEIFGDISDCGWGGFAEYVCATENALVLKPSNISFEEAASVPQAAVVALQGILYYGQIQPGQRILINGASGGIGTFAVQIAKSFGAEVTGVCSTKKMDMVLSLGADYVIDYTKEDFTKNGQRYDLIVDAAAYHSLADYKRALTPQGRYIFIGGAFTIVFKIMLSKKENFEVLSAKVNQKDFIFISELIEEGKVKSVIDKAYPLSQTAEAVRYLESGQARGKVVIAVK